MKPRLPALQAPATFELALPPRWPIRTCTCSRRAFSTTRPPRTRLRMQMWNWLDGPGQYLRHPSTKGPRHLDMAAAEEDLEEEEEEEEEGAEGERTAPENAERGNEGDGGAPGSRNAESEKKPPREPLPFPQNHHFKSEAVLSEELKELIWQRVTQEKHTVRRVSAELQVEMRRVGAVVRLKSIEKQWEQEGKRLAIPYARAVLGMLPQTYLTNPPTPHEALNDLPLHKATKPQLFVPAPESRRFTRVDAGKAFDPGLLPADERLPHPQLVKAEASPAEDTADARRAVVERAWAETEGKDQERVERRRRQDEWEARRTRTVPAGRWEFRIRDVTVDRASVGRHVPGVGARYGVPPQDRKKGQVKIPTRVE